MKKNQVWKYVAIVALLAVAFLVGYIQGNQAQEPAAVDPAPVVGPEPTPAPDPEPEPTPTPDPEP